MVVFGKRRNRNPAEHDIQVKGDRMQGELLLTIEHIAENYGTEMRSRARRILLSDSDAEDAVQETLMTILRSPHMLGTIESLGAWLITLVTRRSIDIIRKESVRKRKETAEDAVGEPLAPDPASLMDRDEAAHAVSAALGKLPEKLRQPFIWNALDGMTFEEMSAKTGIPMGTLMARKKKAQDRIRAALTKQGFAL
jgi:RNA polymerase sigma factor (sigma-70 family)